MVLEAGMTENAPDCSAFPPPLRACRFPRFFVTYSVVLTWVVPGLGVLLALSALAWVRRVSRRLETLTQSYWELRYEYTRLRSQLSRLDAEQGGSPAPEPPPIATPSVSFVPLSTIRKKD